MSGAMIAASMARARRRIERDLEEAVGPRRAIAYSPPRARVSRRIFRQMVGYGAVVEAAPGRFYVAPDRMERFKASRRRRAAILTLVALAGVAATVSAALTLA